MIALTSFSSSTQVLVRQVPRGSDPVGERIEEFFEENHEGEYLTHQVPFSLLYFADLSLLMSTKIIGEVVLVDPKLTQAGVEGIGSSYTCSKNRYIQ